MTKNFKVPFVRALVSDQRAIYIIHLPFLFHFIAGTRAMFALVTAPFRNYQQMWTYLALPNFAGGRPKIAFSSYFCNNAWAYTNYLNNHHQRSTPLHFLKRSAHSSITFITNNQRIRLLSKVWNTPAFFNAALIVIQNAVDLHWSSPYKNFDMVIHKNRYRTKHKNPSSTKAKYLACIFVMKILTPTWFQMVRKLPLKARKCQPMKNKVRSK